MASSISQQHPAVVLRSQYNHLRAILAATLVAVVALAASVVILAVNHGTNSVVTSPAIAKQVSSQSPTIRYDGGPEEGTAGPFVAPRSLTTRPDGGPEEGTRGLEKPMSGR